MNPGLSYVILKYSFFVFFAHILINENPLSKKHHLTSRVLIWDSKGLLSNQASHLCLGLSFLSYK